MNLPEGTPREIAHAIRGGSYRFTAHAEHEREVDSIYVSEIEKAFGLARPEILEDYPEDPRGHSVLALGFTRAGKPLHAVIGISNSGIAILVTIYRPNPRSWDNWRRRKNP